MKYPLSSAILFKTDVGNLLRTRNAFPKNEWTVSLFAVTLFWSAFLLFLMELLFASLAYSLNLAGVSQYDSVIVLPRDFGKLPSQWVIMARAPSALGGLWQDPRWNHLSSESHSTRPWTDDFSNILSVLRGI
jgi:hypothetical protein